MKLKGLTLKITVYIFSAVMLIFAIIYRLNYMYSKDIIENQIEQTATNLTSSTVQSVEKVLMSIEKVPQSLAQSLENTYYSEEEIKNQLKETLTHNKDIYGICVAFEPNGYYK